MNKITFQNSKGINLVGALHLPNEKTTNGIIISHGFTSNKDRARLIKLAEALAITGFAVLRFDFGGCGENEDREITVGAQVDDLLSARIFMKKEGFSDISLIGESLGGLVSILTYDTGIKTMVLLAPVTKSKIPTIIQKEETRQELTERGFIIHKKDGRNFKIPKEYFEEREAVNQQLILSKIKCPVLIIHGDADNTVPLEHSRDAMQFLSKESHLEIVKGGDHKLNDKVEVVVSMVVDWFKNYK